MLFDGCWGGCCAEFASNEKIFLGAFVFVCCCVWPNEKGLLDPRSSLAVEPKFSCGLDVCDCAAWPKLKRGVAGFWVELFEPKVNPVLGADEGVDIELN